jgi:hypothetical protein
VPARAAAVVESARSRQAVRGAQRARHRLARWFVRPARHCPEEPRSGAMPLGPARAGRRVEAQTERSMAERCPALQPAVAPAVRAGLRRAQVRPFVAAAGRARALPVAAQSLAQAQRVRASAAQPKAVLREAAPGAAAELRPVAAALAGAGRRQAAVAPGVAVPRQVGQAGRDGAEALPRVAARGAAARRPAAQGVVRAAAAARQLEAVRGEARDAAARPRAAPGEPEVLPSVPAWAELPSIRCREDRLAPSPAECFARKTGNSRLARRSTRRWPVARGEVLS